MAKTNWVNGQTVQADDMNAVATQVNSNTTAIAGKANTTHTHTSDTITGLNTALDGKQPLDADLTAIAALTTTDYGRSLLTAADAAAARTAIGAAVSDRSTHTGTQSADTLTDGTTNKAYTATEKTKLASVAAGATANSADATLLDRANHTGAQATSTITGLDTALAGKQPLDMDLTAIAGLTTAAFGRSLLTTADATAARIAIGAASDVVLDEATLIGGSTITIEEGVDEVTITAKADPTWGIISSIPRHAVNGNTVATGSGSLRLSYFTAPKTESFTAVRVWSGTTAAAATPTLVRLGVYSVASNGTITLIGSTANDTSLLAATTTAYQRSLTASVNIVSGQRYALGLLVITAATAPTTHGVVLLTNTEAGIDPRICGVVTGQTDLPSSVLTAGIANSNVIIYIALVP